jgi:hypothetical protein
LPVTQRTGIAKRCSARSSVIDARSEAKGLWYGAILGADHEGRGNLTPGHSTYRLPECQQGLQGGSGERFGDSVVVAVAEKQLSQLIRAQDCGAVRLWMHPRHRAGVSGVRVRLTQVRQH